MAVLPVAGVEVRRIEATADRGVDRRWSWAEAGSSSLSNL